ERAATAASQLVIVARKPPPGQPLRVPGPPAHMGRSPRRAIWEGFRRYHNVTGWLMGGRGVQLALKPAARQICRASSHSDRDDEDDDIVAAHCFCLLPVLGSPSTMRRR